MRKSNCSTRKTGLCSLGKHNLYTVVSVTNNVEHSTAVFSFEGIGLVIPITDAMKEPRKFPKVLSGVMLFLMGSFGVLMCQVI